MLVKCIEILLLQGHRAVCNDTGEALQGFEPCNFTILLFGRVWPVTSEARI